MTSLRTVRVSSMLASALAVLALFVALSQYAALQKQREALSALTLVTSGSSELSDDAKKIMAAISLTAETQDSRQTAQVAVAGALVLVSLGLLVAIWRGPRP